MTANLATGAVSGGAGDDFLSTVESLVGSPFADDLRGNSLANEITGLGGVDTISALAGADTVDVRDGGPDTVTCGTEMDSVIADRQNVDALDADCESVSFLPEPLLPEAPPGAVPAPDTELSFELGGARSRALSSVRV